MYSLNDEENFPNGVKVGHNTFEAVSMEGNGEAEFIGVSVWHRVTTVQRKEFPFLFMPSY